MTVPTSHDQDSPDGQLFSTVQAEVALKYSRGAQTRSRILDLLSKPMSRNAIAKTLKLQWNTVSRHIEILLQHGYLKELEFQKRVFYIRAR